LIYCHSYPFKEPGGDRLPAGGSGDALPGSDQTAGACFCAGGGRQDKVAQRAHTGFTFIIIMCSDIGMDTELYSYFDSVNCQPQQRTAGVFYCSHIVGLCVCMHGFLGTPTVA